MTTTDDQAEGRFWVHGAPARNLDQVFDYLTSDDAHDRSKVVWFDGKRFQQVTDFFPIDLRK